MRVSVAVVDANGDLVAFERMDGAVPPSILISQGKAQAPGRTLPRALCGRTSL